MALTFVLSFLLCISVLSGTVWLTQLTAVRRQLQEMAEALSDIQAGNGNRKILAPRNDLTAELSYKLNEIVYCYEEQIYKLKAADEANRQLMTSLSHDVRTPLTTLIGYLDAVHRGIAGPEEHVNYIETARLKAYSLKEYIDLLFDWFKLNSNEFTLSSEKIQLAELTRNILINWIPVFEENQIQYEIDIPEKPVFIHADPDGYERIINNLIQNVIKHSHASKITIQISKKQSDITIQIEDNGIGIDPADLPHIFERLYKCDKERSDKGSGLGLSIARQLTEKMNGWIDVKSKSDHDTAFIICFPAAPD
ncbi:two-component sensor histidine kinase [Lacrimispora amygdalina]|uniref:histidine kinase n=1 Tax=Lacrimispora amygdalina TaxID=253257 RepID=A0ABQ5MAA1_9FIRM